MVEPLPTDDCRPYAGFRSPCTIVTCSHATSSSSATIIGSDVLMPCPISELGAMIVTAPLGAMLMNAFGANSAAAAGAVSAKAESGPNRRYVPINKPPPARALALMNPRRSTTDDEPSDERVMTCLPVPE